VDHDVCKNIERGWKDSSQVPEFDTRMRPSVNIWKFDPDRLDKPAVGSTSRECSIIEIFKYVNREEVLALANAKAREVVEAYKAGRPWYRSKWGGNVNGTEWHVAIMTSGKERCEVQVRDMQRVLRPSLLVEEMSFADRVHAVQDAPNSLH
ncbi:MAG: hypothetical protein Q9181_007124, partial [Wetmoreana brouardii]